MSNILFSESFYTLLKQKHVKRSNSGPVLKMLFFWNQKCSLFEKNVLFLGTNHDCAWKSNLLDTFSVLDLNPNEKKNIFLRVYDF
jgi:hypothetical protein